MHWANLDDVRWTSRVKCIHHTRAINLAWVMFENQRVSEEWKTKRKMRSNIEWTSKIEEKWTIYNFKSKGEILGSLQVQAIQGSKNHLEPPLLIWCKVELENLNLEVN